MKEKGKFSKSVIAAVQGLDRSGRKGGSRCNGSSY